MLLITHVMLLERTANRRALSHKVVTGEYDTRIANWHRQMTSLTGIRPFCVAGALFLFLIQGALIILGMQEALGGRADFRQLYAAGYMLRTGHGSQLYDYRATVTYEEKLAGTTGASLPFNHPAYEALLFAGFSYLSYSHALLAFVFVNLFILIVCFKLLLPLPGWISSLWPHLSVGLFAGFLPVGICLIQGQDSIIMLGLLAGSFFLLEHGRDPAAGVLLALALFKFQFIVPIVVLLAAQRKWRLLAGFFLSALLLLIASILIAGSESVHSYPKYLAAMSTGLHSDAQRNLYGIWPEKMPNLRGLFDLILGYWLPFSALQILTAGSSALFLLWSAKRKLRFELAVMVGFLVSYHCLIHDAVILLLPLLKAAPQVPPYTLRFLAVWTLLAVSPTLAFLLNVPYAVIAISVALFLGSIYLPASDLRSSSRSRLAT